MTEEIPTALPATGERFLTECKDESVAEHLHRYAVAMQLCAGKEVLDIASGEGYGSNLLASVARSVIGVDVSPDAIQHAAAKYKRSNLKYVSGSAFSIPIDSSSIDVAVSFETIEHHVEHEAMLRELTRVLRPDGLLIISTPDKLNYSDRRGIRNEYHVKELYTEEFRELVAAHFKETSVCFQRVTYGSVIVPEKASTGLDFVEGDFMQIKRAARLPMPLYNICLASDAALPTLPISIFGTSIEWSDAMQVKQERVALLEQRIRNISTALHDLESSTSFRLGRVLTAPLRWLSRQHS